MPKTDALTQRVTIRNRFSQIMALTQRKTMNKQLDKALALAAQDIYVFPVHHETSGSNKIKSPRTDNGFLDATTDARKIHEWWTDWPQSLVGYWTGASNLFVLDLDEKDGKSGELLLDCLELDYGSDVSYRTPSGGSHHVFMAPTNRTVRPSSNFNRLEAVDVRAGNSYAIWYGQVPKIRENLRETPAWLLERRKMNNRQRYASGQVQDRGSRYPGEIEPWIEWLSFDTPWFDAKAIEASIDAKTHIGHDDLLRLVYRIHMTRLDGGIGLAPIFLKLVEKFKRTTNNHDGWQRELDDIVRGAIGETWTPNTSPKTAEEGEAK